MKTTTHTISFDLPESDDDTLREIERWLLEKYGIHERLAKLKIVSTGIQAELQIEYTFLDFDDAKKFYRKVIMKMIGDLQNIFHARIASQSSRPSDYAG